MALNRVLAGTAGALQLAGSFSGVPYASGVATVLSGIVATSQQLVIHRVSPFTFSQSVLTTCLTTINKRKCRNLADKANMLLTMLQEQASKLEGTELQKTVDEVITVLERVHKKTRKYSRYSRVMSFINLNQVERGLDKCLMDLDTAMNLFFSQCEY
jgi:hypothetical protein